MVTASRYCRNFFLFLIYSFEASRSLSFFNKPLSRLESCTTPIFILWNNSYSYFLTRQPVIITNCCCHVASDRGFFFSFCLLERVCFTGGAFFLETLLIYHETLRSREHVRSAFLSGGFSRFQTFIGDVNILRCRFIWLNSIVGKKERRNENENEWNNYI